MIKLDKSKLVHNLGKDYQLVPYLDKAFANFDDEWEFKYQEKEKDHHFHPSSHCTEPVTWLYEMAAGLLEGHEEKVSIGLRKAFQVGHFWHQLLQYIVLNDLKFCKPEDIERKATYEWGEGPYHSVAGSADICPCVCPGWTGLIDFKTMAAAHFKRAEIPEFFAVKYECQMNIYMYLFDQPEAIIVCINKDGPHEFKEYRYARNDELINLILDRWKFVSECVDLKTPPNEDDETAFDVLPLLTGPIAS